MGMIKYFALSDTDIDFVFEGSWEVKTTRTTYLVASLAFIDPSLGGSGYLQRIAERFNTVSREALNHINHKGCQTACYRCLKSYDNQRYHEYLSWPRILWDLEGLASITPRGRELQTGDIDDPRPWLEAYAAGVGSPLELKFLRLFEQQGLLVEKQVPISPAEGETAISVADFAIPKARVAIYVDGAAFHVGQNLRRDMFIRNRLRNGAPPWQVIELKARDLEKGKTLVKEIQALIANV